MTLFKSDYREYAMRDNEIIIYQSEDEKETLQ